MAFIPTPDCARVTLVQSLHGQLVSNVIYFQRGAPWSATLLSQLATDVVGWWNTSLAPNLSTDMQLKAVQARDLTTDEAAGVEIQAPPGSTGDVTSPAMPGNVALAIKLITGLTGRNRRGRVYVAGLAESQVGGNVVVQAVTDALVLAFNELVALGAGTNSVWSVNSMYNGTALVPLPNGETRRRPVARPNGVTTPITGTTSDGVLDSQRRRLPGRGA